MTPEETRRLRLLAVQTRHAIDTDSDYGNHNNTKAAIVELMEAVMSIESGELPTNGAIFGLCASCKWFRQENVVGEGFCYLASGTQNAPLNATRAYAKPKRGIGQLQCRGDFGCVQWQGQEQQAQPA